MAPADTLAAHRFRYGTPDDLIEALRSPVVRPNAHGG